MSCEFLDLQEPNEGPYSDLVVVDGKFLFLSGLVSENFETGELVSGDIATETRQILKNLAMILERYGSDMDHVVRVEVILADFSERDAMNAEYVKHFDPTRKPARLCFGGADLADGCKIEMMATAVKK
ncbi:RidA family protein [Dysosmobacter sp.]|uniref:RidA family protein n=1 Tax=Dysosmobacter sp. TaxID=2591382 RepID=UPI002A99079F|nr:RidA family protein [Dysosmobacter sp.]MDY5612728.1 RidA family protein [Dysosmobacter sp.]